MNRRQLTVTRRIFAGGAAAPILLAYLVMVIVARPSLMEAGLVLLQFSPLFLPAAVYYFWVTDPRAMVLCGTILLALTAPPWLLVCAGELHYLAQGPYFLATLVASIVGAVKSQRTAPAT
ncbi:MAG: hypothetical protein KY393_02425 [Actinobacteria bacterium]|nr:hypothetical protein [Actinomycetota bacterium]